MITSGSAKKALLTSVFICSLLTSLNCVAYPLLTKGEYKALGTLRINNQRDFVLVLNEGFRSQRELLLTGKEIAGLSGHTGNRICVHFQVLKDLKSDEPPFVIFKKFTHSCGMSITRINN